MRPDAKHRDGQRFDPATVHQIKLIENSHNTGERPDATHREHQQVLCPPLAEIPQQSTIDSNLGIHRVTPLIFYEHLNKLTLLENHPYENFFGTYCCSC